MSNDDILGVAAVLIAGLALVFSVASWIEARRSANASEKAAKAAERSAASSERSEESASRSAEAAERSAHDGNRLTAMQIDQRHEELRPRPPATLKTTTVTDPARPRRHMVKAALELAPGEGPPRDYRVTITGYTLNNSAVPINSAFTVRPGKTENLFLGSVETGEQLRIVRLAFKFWPNTVESGDPELGSWSCPCGVDDVEDGHWRSSAEIEFHKVGSAQVFGWDGRPVEADEGHTFG